MHLINSGREPYPSEKKNGMECNLGAALRNLREWHLGTALKNLIESQHS